MTMRLNVGGKDRVMSERGITTKVKNRSDGKVYWIITTRKIDGTWITGVAKSRMFGMPGEHLWEITTATSENESMELHFAVEEVVQKQPRDKWEPSLPEARLAAQRVLDEAEQAGLPGAPKRTQAADDSEFPGGYLWWGPSFLGYPVEGLSEEQNRCRAVLKEYLDCLTAKGGSEEGAERIRTCDETAMAALVQISPEALTSVYPVLRKALKRVDQSRDEMQKVLYQFAWENACRLINASLERIGKPKLDDP